MTVLIYDGETRIHPAGFIGVRIECKALKKQKHFTFRSRHNSKSAPLVSEQEQQVIIDRATEMEKNWYLRVEAERRANRVGQNCCNVKPFRATNILGITLAIRCRYRNNKHSTDAFFRTPKHCGSRTPQVFFFEKRGYVAAWRDVVEHWADVYDVDPELRIKALRMMPPVSQFLQLAEYERERGVVIADKFYDCMKVYQAEVDALTGKDAPVKMTRQEQDDFAAALRDSINAFEQKRQVIKG